MGKALKQRDGFLRYTKRTGAPIVAPSNGTGAKNALFGAIVFTNDLFAKKDKPRKSCGKERRVFPS
jgi:hypothetical protein